MAIHRVRVPWTGSPVVGPAVSTFYLAQMSDTTGLTAIKNFFTALTGRIASGVQWTVPSGGDIINESDGTLAGSWSFPGGGGVVSAVGGTIWAPGVGARVQWRTNGLHNERRVVGSTFLVPLDISEFEGAGALAAACVTALQNAATGLVTGCAGDLVIWSRPKDEATADGEVNAVTSAIAPDKVSWLRSRRT